MKAFKRQDYGRYFNKNWYWTIWWPKRNWHRAFNCVSGGQSSAAVGQQSAFDKQDPTMAIKNFLNIGVRPSLIPVLVSYLKDRKMKVKFDGQESQEHSLNQTWYNRVKLVDTICLVSVGRRYDFIIEFDMGQTFLNSKAFIEFFCLIVLPYFTLTSISDMIQI